MDAIAILRRAQWLAGGLGVAALLLLSASSAFACETYVVDQLGHSTPQPWHAQAILEVRVSRVDAAGADFIDRNPLGYQMTVTRTLRGHDVPATFEVVRAAGCDSMNLSLGDRLIVVVSGGVDLHVPRGRDPGYGADNYNSAWYRMLGGGRINLLRASAWVAGVPGRSTIEALVRATNGLPATDAAPARDASGLLLAPTFLAALLLGVRLNGRPRPPALVVAHCALRERLFASPAPPLPPPVPSRGGTSRDRVPALPRRAVR